jgi:hypothetical protein
MEFGWILLASTGSQGYQPNSLQQTLCSPKSLYSSQQDPLDHQWFSMLYLKDALWACPLVEESRDIFAFECEDPPRLAKSNTGRQTSPKVSLILQIWPDIRTSTGRICPPSPDKFVTICKWSSVVWTYWKRSDWCHSQFSKFPGPPRTKGLKN